LEELRIGFENERYRAVGFKATFHLLQEEVKGTAIYNWLNLYLTCWGEL
jgi:hypothetical protein